jgi:hypothetical protein
MTEKWEIGNIDNSPIGSTTPAAGAFTTLAASGNVTPANLTASKPVFTDASKNLVSTGTLGVDQGGTGATTLTDHALVAGSGSAAVTPLSAATNGQLPIGSTGADPVIAALTAGEGIDITNGAGSIQIAGEDASETNKGIVELATDAETVTGSSTTLVTTPANVTARLAAPGTIGGTTPGAGNFTTLTLTSTATIKSLINAASSEAVADEAEITLATGVAGFGFAQAGDNEEWIQFCFTTAGVVTVIANSANAVNTDMDGNLCVYDAGSGIAIKNRLGASKTIRYSVHYSA